MDNDTKQILLMVILVLANWVSFYKTHTLNEQIIDLKAEIATFKDVSQVPK